MSPGSYLTPREAAEAIERVYGLGRCDEAKIRRHIREGRLEAEIVRRVRLHGRSQGRAAYCIFPAQFSAYLATHWPLAADQHGAAEP